MTDPIDALLSEEKDETNLDETSSQAKVEVDGEEFDQEKVKQIIADKKRLEKDLFNKDKSYRELQSMKSKESIATKTDEEQNDDEDFSEFNADRDKRYLTKKIGVATKADLEEFKKEIIAEARKQADETAKVSQEAADLSFHIEDTVKTYPFADKKEIVDYMHFKANSGVYVSPEDAVKRLHPEKFEQKKPIPKELPETDRSGGLEREVPKGKRVGFDDPRAMQEALEEVLFPGEVE